MRVLTPQKQELLLDKKDWRVLKEIIHNVRQPISQIAKNCLLSRQAVEYRLKLLQEKNLLIGSRAVINTRKIGYRSYHVFMEVHVPSQEKEILRRAEKSSSVNAIIVYSGKYNVEISIMARDDEEFLYHYNELIDGIRIRDDHILVLLNTICAEVLPARHFPALKDVRPGMVASGKSAKKRAMQDASFDHLDLQILYALSHNATQANIAMARDLGVSKDTIHYHLEKLEKQGYILEYRPVVNYAALGLTINSVLVKLNYSEQGKKEFELYLKANGSILWATKTLGYYDYLMYVITKDLEEFHDVINGIKEKFDDIIKTYEVLFAFEELKYTFMADAIVKGKVSK